LGPLFAIVSLSAIHFSNVSNHFNETCRVCPICVSESGRSTLLRTAQQWDQVQAGADTQRRAGRQDAFRQRLAALLASERYQHLDKETKELL